MDVKLLRKSFADKMKMKMKKKSDGSLTRFLAIVNVPGSCGPIRLVVSEGDRVSQVTDAAIKLYAKQKRLPQLDHAHLNTFLLYPANADLDALNPSDLIGSLGMRSFILCKKEGCPEMIAPKRTNTLKAWLKKSLTFNISCITLILV